MTTLTPNVIADPRVAPLVELVETLIGAYADLVSTTAGRMPKEHHASLAAHVTAHMSDVRARLDEIGDIAPEALAGR